MKSALTGKNYQTVYHLSVDYGDFLLKSNDGISFKELKDNTWLCVSGEHAGNVRYKGAEVHFAGLALNPIYELVDGNWFWILTGKPAPPAINKQYKSPV